jgi:hypothetical protein
VLRYVSVGFDPVARFAPSRRRSDSASNLVFPCSPLPTLRQIFWVSSGYRAHRPCGMSSTIPHSGESMTSPWRSIRTHFLALLGAYSSSCDGTVRGWRILGARTSRHTRKHSGSLRKPVFPHESCDAHHPHPHTRRNAHLSSRTHRREGRPRPRARRPATRRASRFHGACIDRAYTWAERPSTGSLKNPAHAIATC